MKKSFWMISTGLSILASSGAMAQNTPVAPAQQTNDSPGNRSQDDGKGLNEIVVTAQKRNERLQDVPLTISAVSRDDLTRAGVTSLSDIQTMVPGFTFSGQGPQYQPSIRGVSTTVSAAGAENPNALYVDGIYQASRAVLGNELPDVERVEILKGPQGTLFGRNATGGAIQIFTRGPSFETKGDFTADESFYTGSGSSRSSPRINLRGFVTGPLVPDLLAASISGGYDWVDGYYTNDVTGGRAGRATRATARGKLLLTPGADTEFTLSGFYIRNNDATGLAAVPYHGLSAASVYPGSIVPDQPWHLATDPAPYFGAVVRQYGGSFKALVPTGIGAFTLLSGYTKTELATPNSIQAARGTTACLQAFACIDYNYGQNNREISDELNFASNRFGILRFVAGLFYYNADDINYADIQGSIVPGGIPIQDTLSKIRAYAAYGEVTITPVQSLSIVVGARQGHEKHTDSDPVNNLAPISKTFNATTPRFSVRYTINPRLSVYATVSEGYKSGMTGIANVAADLTPVAPEKLYAYEIGMKYGSRNLTINGSIFYYNFKNKQEETFTGTATVVTNTGPVTIYGLDLDANARLSEDFHLRGALSWIPTAKYKDFPDATGSSTVRGPNGAFLPGIGDQAVASFDATGFRLIRTPRITASASLSYEHQLARGKVDASATLFYSSTVIQELTATVKQKPYATLNAQAGYRFGDSGIRVGIFGRNLTNKAYIIQSTTSSASFWAGYAPPREIGLSASYAF